MHRFAIVLAGVLVAPGPAAAYPGGTPDFQTDVAPFCASCHSIVDASSLAGAPPDRVEKELAENKHIAQILKGDPRSGYASLTQQERELLARQIRTLDQNSTVTLEAPDEVAPGEVFDVVVNFRGGGGPVAGIALVDRDHRWWARSAPAAGWKVVDAPVIRGDPEGQPQTAWIEKRPLDLGRNVSYVNVADISSDVTKDSYAEGQAVFRVKAPAEFGKHPISAVYFYGTELATPLGWTVDPKDPLGRKQIRGGFGGASGRVRFTPVKQIEVKAK